MPYSDAPETHGPDASPLNEGGLLDPLALWAVFRRRWLVLLAVFLVFVGLAVAYTLNAPKEYTAMSTVMLGLRSPDVVKNDQVLSSLPVDTTIADTQVEVLRSRRLATIVAQLEKLDKDPEFNGDAPGLIGRLKRLIPTGAPYEAPTPAERLETATDSVQGALSVERRGLTYVIDINFTSRSAQKAATIANAFAQAYLNSQLDAKTDATHKANAWLEEKVNELRGEVTSAEQNSAQYQASQGMLATTGSALSEQQVSTLQQDLAHARADLAEKQSRLSTARRQIEGGRSGEALSETLNSPVIQNLRNQLAVANSKRADLLTRYGAKHPDVISSDREVAQLQQTIDAEVARIIASLEAEVTASQSRLVATQANLGAAQGTLVRNKSAQVGLNELDRNAAAKRSLYQSYLDRLQQTSSQSGLATPDANLVALADPPADPSRPRVVLNILIGILGGLSGGLALVALLELIDTTVRTSSQIEQKLGEVYAASVPLLPKGSPVEAVIERPLSAFAEAFRKLKVFVQHTHESGPVKVLVIASALPREGKTTTSLCFARSLALSGTRVLLVDCDLRVRSLSRMVSPDAKIGLTEVLSGAAGLTAATLKDARSGADILPVSTQAVSHKDLFGSEEMDKLLTALRARYDLVILDCPPVLAVSDALTLAAKADGTLFLLRWRSTSARAAQHGLAALRAADAKVLGVALTQVNMKAQSAHGYGDGAYYYKKYKNYYVN